MSLRHILFPIDFSDNSEKLTRDVEVLAAQFPCRVTLLHVFEIPITWYAASEATFVNPECFRAIADSVKRRLDDWDIGVPGHRLERIQVEGDPATEISDWAAQHDVDLIVMGTQGHSRIGGLLVGSVLANVMHKAAVPVWTRSLNQCSNCDKEPAFRAILCAIDITEEAFPILLFAKRVAAALGASVRLLHCIPDAHRGSLRCSEAERHNQNRELAREEILSLQRQAGTDFPLLIDQQPLSAAVSREAADRGTDLIVIGRGKSQNMFGGLRTHVYDLVREAPCPVLSYRQEQVVRVPATLAQPVVRAATL